MRDESAGACTRAGVMRVRVRACTRTLVCEAVRVCSCSCSQVCQLQLLHIAHAYAHAYINIYSGSGALYACATLARPSCFHALVPVLTPGLPFCIRTGSGAGGACPALTLCAYCARCAHCLPVRSSLHALQRDWRSVFYLSDLAVSGGTRGGSAPRWVDGGWVSGWVR